MRVKTISALTVVAFSTVALTGCAGGADSAVGDAGSCKPVIDPGAVSALYAEQNGAGDSIPPVKTPIGSLQRTVTGDSGETAAVQSGVATAVIKIFSARTGKKFYDSAVANPKGSDFVLVGEEPSGNIFSDGLHCAAPGERVTVAMDPKTALMFATQKSDAIDGAIAYIDVQEVSAGNASGRLQPLPNGFPAVTRDAEGNPGVVLPPQAPPQKERHAATIVGESDVKVGSDSTVVVQALIVGWDGEVRANTRSDIPTVIDSSSELHSSLVGYPVGSQVVVLQPATGNTPAAGVVLDILAVN